MKTMQERMMGRIEGDFVVFLIGMRINRWWKPHRWLPVALGMPRMLAELAKNPDLGFLGGEQWFGRTTIMVSYWRSMDHLMGYARNRSHEHLPAWRAFNKRVGTHGDVGIWHETYPVHAGEYENIYVNMPTFGMGKIGELVGAGRKHAPATGELVAAR